jgi:hypothetical protein
MLPPKAYRPNAARIANKTARNESGLIANRLRDLTVETGGESAVIAATAVTGVAVVLLVSDSLKAEAGMVTWVVSLVVEARLLGLTEGIDD